MQPMIRCGTVLGAGAAIKVELGFKPDIIEVYDITTGTRFDRWQVGMAQATSIKVSGTAGPVTQGTNGLSQMDGSAQTPVSGDGFIIGSNIATASSTLAWKAERRGAGAQG